MGIIRFLFSGVFMGILLIVFATAIGYATFIENDFDATTARILVYNARWFEYLLALMVINFIGMIFTKQLYKKQKLNILLIHVALVVIILGAAITRYMGFEGTMHIRNGETSNTFQSYDSFVIIDASAKGENKKIEKKLLVTPEYRGFYATSFTIGNQQVDLSFDRFYTSAKERLVADPNGESYINLIVGGNDGRHDLKIREGQSIQLHETVFSFGDTTHDEHVQIIKKDQELWIKTPANLIDTTENGMIAFKPPAFVPFKAMTLFQYKSMNFILKQYLKNGSLIYEPSDNNTGSPVSIAAFTINGKEYFTQWGQTTPIQLENAQLDLYAGQVLMELPFSLKLNEFQLERYPGSRAPSSYASDIQLIDETNGKNEPYKIYMNNILSYQGYRFYQSSYDNDEKGTVLTVNKDLWGTRVTYLGYFLLFATLIISFFTQKTRFRRILRHINNTHEQRKKQLTFTLVFLSLFSLSLQAQDMPMQSSNVDPVDEAHAQMFGQLLVQNHDGRMMPVNTMATQLMIKVHKKNSYEGLTPEQTVLGIMNDPIGWHMKPFVKINHEEVQKMLGIKGEYARYIDFFNENRQFKIKDLVDRAHSKSPATRNQFDKELIKVNERLSIFHSLLQDNMLKILPVPNDPANRWTTHASYHMHTDTVQHAPVFSRYLDALSKAIESGDYTEADKQLSAVASFQKSAGAALIPSDLKISLEILYNKLNVFKNLFPIYFVVGLLLVAIFFIQILIPKYGFSKLTRIFYGLLILAFAIHTIGLIIRWYISGHAPWSNGYESMIYISWATMLAGFLFMKQSPITLALTSTLAGITLLTAHMSWMDPEITNLVPVLKSYWLTIHVATITASYGFLGLGAFIGFFNLFLMSFRNKNNQDRLNLMLKELTLIIELTLMSGLVLLIIGNFLGAIWANESWGRYWGWDPKETWTLVTIVYYSFVLHMNLIPGMRNFFTINFFSLIGFGTILMTYFGVNFYLTGLHSYANGDPVPIPTFVYYGLIVIGIISTLALVNQLKLKYTLEEA